MQTDQVLDEISSYVRDEFLDGDHNAELTPSTPLLEWGILNSLNTTRLLTHIRETWGVSIPPQRIVGTNFRDLNSLTAMVLEIGEPIS